MDTIFTRQIAIPWNDEILKNQQYYPMVFAALSQESDVENDLTQSSRDIRALTEQKATAILKQDFGFTTDKTFKVIDALVKTQDCCIYDYDKDSLVLLKNNFSAACQPILTQDGEILFCNNTKFQAISKNMWQYCYDNFRKDNMAVRTVIYLCRMWNWIATGGINEYRVYATGNRGILARIGYSPNGGTNQVKIENILRQLQDDGVLGLSEVQHGRSIYGRKETYRVLEWIKEPKEKMPDTVIIRMPSDMWVHLADELYRSGYCTKDMCDWGYDEIKEAGLYD